MTKEQILERPDRTTTDPWAITDKVRELAAEGRKEVEMAKENFEKLTPPCPTDGIPSRFIRYEGAFPRVRGVFKCTSGHEFYYG